MKIIFLFLSLNAFSALPPYYHSVKEIEDLMNSAELATTLGMEKEIIEISRGQNTLIVKTKDCSVEVKSKNIGNVEPKFEYQVGKLKCL
ncbi:MAG: hypothetical protein ACHQYQ_02565 [Bacteriovoracales bacterium]